MKVTIKARLEKIANGKEVKTGYACDLILFRPAGRDEFGDRVGSDQYYAVSYFARNAADVQSKIGHMIGKAVEADCYLNGREVAGNRGLFYSLSLNLKSINLIS